MPIINENNEEIKDSGFVFKNLKIQTTETSDEDMKKINKFTLEPLTKEDVYTFKMMVGDNELDDRNFEPFNINALKDLQKLYIGKTVIKDHYRKADNQVARVYDTELVTTDKVTGANEVHAELYAKVYMVKTNNNADLIAEIKGGIKKEVSTGCVPKKAVCSICGTDNTKTPCIHYWGKEYDTANGKKTCYFTLDGCKEAYELSLVAVPAQPRAGTCKAYGCDKSKNDLLEEEPKKPIEEDKSKEQEFDAKIKSIGSFLFVENENHSKENI